ncbi:MAG: RNA polymerase sigma factor [Anaerolineae bacterium]|jgi:RNA polymerase sigma-70 factor (ECF subfamily)|nr:RNA polymerase sigma factor [Anaerolineae bacterium]
MIEEPHIRAAIQRLRRGEIEGLAVLVAAYQIKALRAAYLVTQDKHAAEDIVQAAFVRVYERIAQYDPTRAFGPWFMRVVVNDALAVCKRQNRQIPLDDEPDTDTNTLATWLRDGGDSPDLAPEAGELREAVRLALDTLTPDQRAAVVLRYYLGFNESEMVDQIGAPPGTVKWRLHAARKRLRALLHPFRSKPAWED